MNSPAALILLNKPYGVLTQFTARDDKLTLAEFINAPGFYPAGRLDYDSEGLVLLTNSGPLQARLTQPRSKVAKTYWAQVDGTVGETALEALRNGVHLNDGPTLPAQAQVIAEPAWLWPRNPPIRYRKAIPTTWIALTLREGRNRQVRRMTAAVGHPTLRLIRWSAGPWSLEGLAPGESRQVPQEEVMRFLRSRRVPG